MLADAALFLLPVATHVVLASCKATLAIALVLLCRSLFARRLSARARHGLWLVVLAALLLPWGFGVPIQLPREPAVVPVQTSEAAGAAARQAAEVVAAAPLPAAAGTPFRDMPIRSWMVLLWEAVALALATVPAWNLLRCRRVVRCAVGVSGPARDLLQQCAAQMGLQRQVRLLESTDITSPALFGWRSPAVLLPGGLQQRLDSTRLRHVLLHELAHVRRHDILVNWLATGAQVVHWFNPVVWHGLRAMRSDMELACDAQVLRHLPAHEHADYGRTLIDVLDAFPGPVPAQSLGVIESQAQLRERIGMIAKSGSRRAGVPVVAVVLWLCLAGVAATQPQVGTQPRAATVEARPATPAIIIQVAKAAQPQPQSEPAPVARQSKPAAAVPVPAAPVAEPAADAVLVQDLNRLRVPGKVLAVLWTRRKDQYTLQVVFPPQTPAIIADTIARLRQMTQGQMDPASGGTLTTLEPPPSRENPASRPGCSGRMAPPCCPRASRHRSAARRAGDRQTRWCSRSRASTTMSSRRWPPRFASTKACISKSSGRSEESISCARR